MQRHCLTQCQTIHCLGCHMWAHKMWEEIPCISYSARGSTATSLEEFCIIPVGGKALAKPLLSSLVKGLGKSSKPSNRNTSFRSWITDWQIWGCQCSLTAASHGLEKLHWIAKQVRPSTCFQLWSQSWKRFLRGPRSLKKSIWSQQLPAWKSW